MRGLASAQIGAIQSGPSADRPVLAAAKIGVVSRDYRRVFPNTHRDFSYALPLVLRDLDTAGCDTALFSLFGYVPRAGFSPFESLEGLRHLKTVCLEEFTEDQDRIPGRYVIFYKTADGWHEYALRQRFGTTSGMERGDIADFVENEIPRRVVGNCCILICGETNGVKYSPRDKHIHDVFGLRAAIPSTAKVILNPVHDRMTRFEMKLKRRFLSENDRWVISVWNKGKRDRKGRVRDGVRPAWTVYHDGQETTVAPISNDLHLEIGIVDVSQSQVEVSVPA